MRISSAYFFKTGLNAINEQQADLLHLYRQTASGQRMITPEDDPLGAAQAVNLSQSQSLNARYAENREVIKMDLNTEEQTLNSVTLLLQDIKTRLIEVGNGAMSDADRATLAQVLSNSKDTLMGLANSTDGNGNYLFSGHKASQPAFDAAGAYQGGAASRLVQADQTRQLAAGDLGSAIFTQAAAGSRAYTTQGNPANTGTGTIAAPSITNPQAARVGERFSVEFSEDSVTGDLQYTINYLNDSPAGLSLSGPHNYDPAAGALELADGIRVAFSGIPEAGDSFVVSPAGMQLPYQVEAETANTGDGVISLPRISDPLGNRVGESFEIVFADPGSGLEYTVAYDDATFFGPVPYSPPNEVTLALSSGVQVNFSGTPNVGDVFNVKPQSSPPPDINIFGTLDDIINALRKPTADSPANAANLANFLASAMQKIDVNYDQVLTVRASVGSRLNELDAIDATGGSRALGFAEQLSRLEDVDYYQVTTQLELRRAALEAAAMAFKKIQGTSLFNMGGN